LRDEKRFERFLRFFLKAGKPLGQGFVVPDFPFPGMPGVWHMSYPVCRVVACKKGGRSRPFREAARSEDDDHLAMVVMPMVVLVVMVPPPPGLAMVVVVLVVMMMMVMAMSRGRLHSDGERAGGNEDGNEA
jgi:hypothetical protein